jgi:preprotein translocase subunit SecB
MDLPNGEMRHTVELKLEAEPNADTPGFPYKLQITLVGVFDGRQLPEEKREALVAVNGASMLYGVAREILLGLTSRAVQGAVMLPTVEFSQLAEQIKPAVVGPTDSPLKA